MKKITKKRTIIAFIITTILLGAGFFLGLRQFKINQAKAQDFSWGVLAINTNKATFKPGEQVKFDIAVLDETGLPVCDADLKLKITHLNEQGEIKEEKLSTEDKTIIVNPECEIHNRTTKPDYEASLPAEGVGRYQLRLDAKTKNGIKSMESYFDVQENNPFDIERNLSTRIYPPKPYPVDLKITASQDFQGLIKEIVPESLTILPSLDYAPYDNLEEKDGQKILSWQVDLKKGQQIHLGYRFDLPEKSPDFFELGPLTIGNFQESRAWQLASDAIVSNIIVMWPGSTTLPDGWQRKTELDGYFIESGIGSGSTNPESNTALGSAIHSHTAPNHSHTIGHTHLMPTQAALDVAPHSGTSTGAAADTHVHGTQMDSGTSSVANNDPTGVKNIGGSVGVWNTAPSDPPYTSVIFIKSNGTNNIPNGAWAFYYSTAPTGWNRVNANQYVKGAAGGGAGGGTGGAVGHSHTDSGHTHTESAHTHTGSSSGHTNSKDATGGVGTTYAPSTHTHTLTADSQTATEGGGVGLGATNNGEPLFIKVNTIKNDTGSESLPDNVIAIWTGSTGSIPGNWYLCDGTNSTPNLNIGRFIKGADTDVGIGTTGGASTHTHASGGTHTHTINNHTHSWTVGGNSGTGVGAVTSNRDTNVQGHTHEAAPNATSGGNSGPENTTADANTDNRPLYKNVYLIQYHSPKITVSGRTDVTSGNVALAVNGNLQGSTAPISGGTWSISNVNQPNTDEIVTTWVSGAADADKSTAVTKYDGSGNVTDMILNKNALSVGSSDASPSINITNLGLYDYDNTTDIIHDADSGVLTIDPGTPRFTDEKLDILSTTILSIGNGETANTHNVAINGTLTSGTSSTYNISGSWDNNNTFNASSSTVYFTASSGTETIDSTGAGTSSFNNLQHTGASTLQLDSNLDVNGNFTQTAGTLNCNSKNQNYAGGFSLSNGTTYQKGGTLTFDGSGSSAVSDATTGQQDLGTVVVNGSNKTITTSNNVKLTTLNIGDDDILNIDSDTLTILGNGTPFAITAGGTFTATGSTVIYAGTTASNITTTLYNNLTLTPASGTPTFSLTGNLTGTTAMSGNLTINTGANLDTISGSNYGITLAGNWDNNGTFTANNSTVTFSKTSSTQNVDGGSSPFWHVIHSGAGTMQLDTTGINVDGDFSQTLGGFNANGLSQNYAGGFSLSNGTTYQKGGTLTFDGSVSADVADATTGQQDLGAVVVDGSSKPITTSNNMKLTTLTIGANDSLDISSDILTILGSGTSFAITAGGAFTTTSSTVIYAGTTATNIVTTLYNNLTVDPASGTPTYSLTGHLITTNALTGNLTISSDGALDTTGSNFGITLAGNWSNAGSFTANTSTVTFSKSSDTQTVNGGSSPFWHVIHSGAGTMQLDTNGIDVNGDFSQTAGGFNANGKNQNYAGGFSLSNGTTYQKGGNLTFDGSGSSAISDATTGQQDLGAVVVDGSSKPVTTSTDMKLTTLTIGANDSLDISSDILTILGSGTPFTITAGGAFTTTSSTVIYAGTTNTNVTTTLYNNLTFTPASGTPTFSLTGNLIGGSAMNGNLTINSSANLDTVSGSNYGITLAGSWDNNGTFTAQNSMVTFNATSGSKTIEAGNSSFYDIVFNSATGVWTIQTDNLTANRNFTVTDVSSLAIAASKTVEVDGTYSVVDAEVDDITWNSNSVLYLKSGTPYTVGSKNQAVATYAILQIGASADIRLWNSTANTFTVITGGSLYSQDHANVNGDLYIWGDYHTQTAENPDHDYWSYAIDFDGTNLSGGSERQVDVQIDPSSSVTVDSGDTLAAIGTSPNRTTIDRQGAVNGYGLTSAGGTINFEYTNFDHLDGNKGFDIQTSSTVTSLNYTTFNNLVGTTAPDDAFITVASTVIGIGTSAVFTGVQINNNGAGAEFNVNRTGSDYAGYWDFDASTGDFDGEAFDGKNGANEADPGMLRWDNSNKNPIAPTALLTEGATNPTSVTDETPEFSAVFNDLDTGDTANAYQIQIDDDINFGSPIWDSTKTALSPTCNQGNRCTDISYAGSALTHGTQYYWKIKFWDIGDLEGAWSTGSNYFIINNAPLSPTVLWTEGQGNPSAIHDTTPEFSAIYNDSDTSDIADFYQIQVDDDSGFGSPIWDSTKTALSPTCNQGNRCTDISYSGSALSQGVTYYWQIKYWDDGGLAGDWSTGSNYFTLSQAPTAPTDLLTEGATNPVNVSDTTPEFSAVYNDLDTGDTANAYQIQVDDNQNFGSPIWDSGQQSMTNCNQGSRCQDISYSGSALTEGTQYYWQIKYWDDGGLAGDWSTGNNYFIINSTPLAPDSLLTEGQTNPTDVSDATPEFSAAYNDPNTNDIANYYQIQVADNQSFTGPIWDSGQQSMTNCNQGSRCQDISYTGSILAEQTRYYWRIKYWDDGGLEGAWSMEEAYFELAATVTQFRFRDIRVKDLRIKPTN